jgi:L-glyceraldehyde 3-phosphate reductase
MALAWVLRGSRVTTALIGASRPEQVVDCVGVIENLNFTEDELLKIDRLSGDLGINLWAESSEI